MLDETNFTSSFNDSLISDFKELIEASFEDFQKTVEGKDINQESR